MCWDGFVKQVVGLDTRISCRITAPTASRPTASGCSLVDVLRGHRALQRTEREAAGDRWQEHGLLLFTTKIGTPIEARNINRHFDQLCERAGTRARPASFVRDAALRPGRAARTDSGRARAVTKSIYVEATRRVQQDAVDRLGFVFDA